MEEFLQVHGVETHVIAIHSVINILSETIYIMREALQIFLKKC